jgi:hypothetical protein
MCTCVRVYLCSYLIFLTGCTQLKQVQNLDQLLVLKEYSEEKEAQGKWIEQETENFNGILAAVRDGSIKNSPDRESIREQFGDPVIIENIEKDNAPVEQWLYRHPLQKLAFERVYLYFDSNGRLVRYEIVTPPNDGQKVVDFNTHSQDL